MLKKFVQFLGIQDEQVSPTNLAPETESIRNIIKSLDSLGTEKAHYVALFASILSRVAHADLNMSDVETRSIENTVMKIGGLDKTQSVLVTEIAKNQNKLLGGVENYLITREFSNVASKEQLFDLMESLFAVAAAEEGISAEENQEISRIADEIGLSRQDFLAVRAKFREDLNVLKGIPKT
jgi:uncharacterized tellurite resistance protein B-like protein